MPLPQNTLAFSMEPHHVLQFPAPCWHPICCVYLLPIFSMDGTQISSQSTMFRKRWIRIRSHCYKTNSKHHIVNVYTLVQHYTTTYSEIGTAFSVAMLCFLFNVYYVNYIKKLYVAPPSVLPQCLSYLAASPGATLQCDWSPQTLKASLMS